MSAEEALFQRFGKEFKRGDSLFREGEPGREMYVLQAGRVAISKKVRDVEKVLAVLGPGEFFGEMAIISNKPRNATAIVEEDARLLVIDPRTFEAMIRGNSEIAVRMIKKLADRLSDADAQIETLLIADPFSRLVHHLLQLCQQTAQADQEEVEVDFPAAQLQGVLAVGEPAIRLMLARLERSGLITTSGDRVAVRDTARLFDFLRYLDMKWKFGEL
jgi:CRP/FNR family cyclic AMP-dependent transcriptional regulator